MLTRPPGNNPLPAVVFVQWLSCDTVAVADRNDGWTQMLRGLIEQSGWVVARMDKRGVGESGGGPCAELDYNTELADHRAHLAAVKRHPWVDPERVVIFGGSMGGNFAPLVARGQRVAGVAAWGGGATTWYERQLGFERRALEFGATAAADINPRMSAIANFYAGYLLHGKSPADLRATKPEHNQAWGWMTGTSGDLHYGRPAAFHQQAQQQNWSAAWAQVQAPVFVAYGEFDWLALAFLALNAALASAAPLTVSEWLHAAHAAHYGQERPAALAWQWQIDELLVYESRRPSPPWDRATVWRGVAIDPQNERFYQEEIRRGGGYEQHYGTWVAQDSWRLNLRRGTQVSVEEGYAGLSRAELLLMPGLLLSQLRDQGAFEQAKRIDPDRGVRIRVADMTLELDAGTHRVLALEHGFTDYDGTFVPQRIKFTGYAARVGLLQPTGFQESFWGEVVRRGELKHIVRATAEHFVRPALQSLERTPPELSALRVEELHPGVHLVGSGVFYQVFVEHADHFFAMDATSGDVAGRLAAVKTSISEKPVRYALVTHHHNDHLHGLELLHQAGAEFVVAATHADSVRARLPEARVITIPDGGARRFGKVLVTDIGPLPHSEHMLVGFVEAAGLLYESDLFVLGSVREPARVASANARALYNIIQERGWAVNLLVDTHSTRVATFDDLRRSVVRAEQATPTRPTERWQ
eukprot:g16265.t1